MRPQPLPARESAHTDTRPRVSEDAFTKPHSECPEPAFWSAHDAASAEYEVTSFLCALVRLTKPRLVVETGAFHGFTTVALANAVRDNGRGRVISVELEPTAAQSARDRIASDDLFEWATVILSSSLEWLPDDPIDLLFLDAGAGWHRANEFLHFRPRMHPGTFIAVHDTARKNRLPRDSFVALAGMGMLTPLWFANPRGLLLAQPRWPPMARRAIGAPRYALVRSYSAARALLAKLRRRWRHD